MFIISLEIVSFLQLVPKPELQKGIYIIAGFQILFKEKECSVLFLYLMTTKDGTPTLCTDTKISLNLVSIYILSYKIKKIVGGGGDCHL